MMLCKCVIQTPCHRCQMSKHRASARAGWRDRQRGHTTTARTLRRGAGLCVRPLVSLFVTPREQRLGDAVETSVGRSAPAPRGREPKPIGSARRPADAHIIGRASGGQAGPGCPSGSDSSGPARRRQASRRTDRHFRSGGQGRDRSADLPLFRRTLFRLSYLSSLGARRVYPTGREPSKSFERSSRRAR